MTRVLIVDDHALFREGLAKLISSKADFEVVGQAENGLDAINKAKQVSPDVILMDISMPVLDGIAATKEILKQSPQCTIVILTMSEDSDDLLTALSCGAQGYLLKSSSPTELFRQLERILQGHSPVVDSMAGKIITKMAQAPAHPNDLSERESEIAVLVAKGLTNKEIATKLFITENTVKKHLSNILSKLGLENRTQLARHTIIHDS